MPLSKCPECKSDVSDQAVSCPKCGCPLKDGKWVCPGCGETIDAEFDACWKCAGKTSKNAETATGAASSPPGEKKDESRLAWRIAWNVVRIGVAIWMLFNCSFVIGDGFAIMHKRQAGLNNIIVFRDQPRNFGQAIGTLWGYKGIIFGIDSRGVHFFQYW